MPNTLGLTAGESRVTPPPGLAASAVCVCRHTAELAKAAVLMAQNVPLKKHRRSQRIYSKPMERSQKMLFLLIVCLVTLAVGYGLYLHSRKKAQAPSELKTGLKVLTDPESVVSDLEK
jgi:hypothetical protein